MKVVVEFYRTREKVNAHAVIGREVVEAADLANALGLAREMSRTLDMPQRPDVMTLTDEAERYSIRHRSIPIMQRKPAMNDQSKQPIIRVEGARIDSQYGRRVEMDRSWTIYHVFTGVPAHVCGQSMTGLNRADATSGMLRLNARGVTRPLSPFDATREHRP